MTQSTARDGRPWPSQPGVGQAPRLAGAASAREAAQDLATADAEDAAAYVTGRIGPEEYRRRAQVRHGDAATGGGSSDPVVVFDAMWEAGTSLFGAYVWLADHAPDPRAADRWWEMALTVKRRRRTVDARDVQAQRAAMQEFLAEERAIRGLVAV